MKKCDADSIYAATKEFLSQQRNIDITTKLAGLGSDGAAVMVGRHSGVATKFKAEVKKYT